MKVFLVSLILLSFSFGVMAEEHGAAKAEPTKKAAVRPTPISTPETKRSYTESEFKKAVMDEIERQMRRLGQSKLIDLSKELLEKEDKIKLRELDLQRHEEQFKLSSKQFQDKVKAFEATQNKFIGCVEDLEQKKNNRVKHMVEVISGMKPDTAAQVLSVQDSEISVEIISQLEPAKISKIFNLMDKEISARLQKQYMNMKK